MPQLLFPRLSQACCLSFLKNCYSIIATAIPRSALKISAVLWDGKREFPSSSLPDCPTAQHCVPNIPSPLPADSRGSWGDLSHVWGYGLPHCASSLESYSHISLAFPCYEDTKKQFIASAIHMCLGATSGRYQPGETQMNSAGRSLKILVPGDLQWDMSSSLHLDCWDWKSCAF